VSVKLSNPSWASDDKPRLSFITFCPVHVLCSCAEICPNTAKILPEPDWVGFFRSGRMPDLLEPRLKSGKSIFFYLVLFSSQLCWPPAILFYRGSLDLLSFFSPRNLRGRLADRHQTLPEIWVAPSLEIWRPQNIKILRVFRPRLHRDYLPNAKRYRQSLNSVANYGLSHTGKLNSVYFGLGPQTAKNRTGVRLTQRATIRLGIATHLVLFLMYINQLVKFFYCPDFGLLIQ